MSCTLQMCDRAGQENRCQMRIWTRLCLHFLRDSPHMATTRSRSNYWHWTQRIVFCTCFVLGWSGWESASARVDRQLQPGSVWFSSLQLWSVSEWSAPPVSQCSPAANIISQVWRCVISSEQRGTWSISGTLASLTEKQNQYSQEKVLEDVSMVRCYYGM